MICVLGLLGLASFGLWSAPAAGPAEGKSGLEADPSGWVDLLPGKDLQGWKRAPILPDKTLNAKNPWSVDAAQRLLICDGVGVKEMLLEEKERGDGIFHVEWRFRPVPGKDPAYNSGVYVRTFMDGTIWHQAQVAHVDKPPHLGDLFGDTRSDGQIKRAVIEGKGYQLGKKPGEWNTYEVTCKGKTITVWVNGAVATTWTDCQVPRGHAGLQAEFYFIEFRNLKFKDTK
jgi:hypothetical protein